MTTSRCFREYVATDIAGASAALASWTSSVLVAIVFCATLPTRASAICLDDGCNRVPCHPCNEESACYNPCSSPSLWCYASAGCGGAPVCSECNPSSSCYVPCSLTCFDAAACGAGPTDPSPIECGAVPEGEPVEGAINLGFASVVEENAPADTFTGSVTLCVDIPPAGQTRTLFAGVDDPGETSQGIASSVVRNFNLPQATMTGPSLSANDRRDITNCVQQLVNTAMAGSADSITVTNTCPSFASHERFARVIVGNASSNLRTAMSGDDGASAVLRDCRPRRKSVALVDTTTSRNNRHRCETIVHEFFHTLGLTHVQNRPAGTTQDIMQNPAVAGTRHEPTDTDNPTKSDALTPCAPLQNTKKKVQEAVAKVVQPECGDGSCEGTKNENCDTCGRDCAPCGTPLFCGDHTCNGAETCDWCPEDCGQCGTPGPTGGPTGGGPSTICCEADGSSSCLFIPCGLGWRCINNTCSPGCTRDEECAFLCTGPEGGRCECTAGQCKRTTSCLCNCTGGRIAVRRTIRTASGQTIPPPVPVAPPIQPGIGASTTSAAATTTAPPSAGGGSRR